MKSRTVIAKALARLAKELAAGRRGENPNAIDIKSFEDITSFDMLNQDNFEAIWRLLVPYATTVVKNFFRGYSRGGHGFGTSADFDDALEFIKIKLFNAFRSGSHLNKEIDSMYGAPSVGIKHYLFTAIGNAANTFFASRNVRDNFDGGNVQLEDVGGYADNHGLTPEQGVYRASVGELLHDALQEMLDSGNKHEQNMALALKCFYLDEESCKETARQVGCRPSSVTMLLTQARRHLADVIRRKAGGMRSAGRVAATERDLEKTIDEFLEDKSFWDGIDVPEELGR